MIDIIEVENGVWILEEDGQSVLLSDCQRFGINRRARKSLMDLLTAVAELLREGKSLDELVKKNVLKKLARQKEASEANVWEVRSEEWGGRLLFVMKEPDSIVIAAVDKAKGLLSQTINRGVNRWKNFLKENEKSLSPKRWGLT